MARRRTVLQAGIGSVGGAALVGAGAAPAFAEVSAARTWCPDPDSPRFTLAVMPDTQYLFDEDRIHPAPLAASLTYLLDNAKRDNIVFLTHLGDMTEHGLPGEMDRISETFALLDRHGAAYSVLGGNHDVGGSTDDQRGPSPYLKAFGPRRFARARSFGGATPDGYNTYHRFRAAGREWLVLALEWRPTAGAIAWAREVIARNPRTPVILTTHELVYAEAPGGSARLSDFGQQLWDRLIADHDQIFLTLNGHFWPPGRTTLSNRAGNDVHLHITNYQNRYYGGAAMIRLYHFDVDRDTIDVETISPWILGRPERERNRLAREEAELTGPADRFSVAIDFTRRFAGFAPAPVRGPRPPREVLVHGTVAYWRFDHGSRFPDLSGHGNDLVAVGTGLTGSPEHHPDQPAHHSLRFTGGKAGAYLQTVAGAPINGETFRRGYTVEAFFKLPADWSASANAWSAILSRWGMAGEAGRKGGDPQEPVATLSLSDGPGLQWAVYPLNQDGVSTNWGHELPLDRWWHVAVVNDGRHTVMYVDGCEVVRNPATPAVGIGTIGRPWMIGGYEYGGVIDQVFDGWIGDVRIADHALPVSRFMTA